MQDRKALEQVLDLMRQQFRGELNPSDTVGYLRVVMEDVFGSEWHEADKRPRVQYWTTAPQAYDGFGTRDLPTRITGFRRVSIVVEHLDWQLSRYQSGTCAAVSDEDMGLRLFRREVNLSAIN